MFAPAILPSKEWFAVPHLTGLISALASIGAVAVGWHNKKNIQKIELSVDGRLEQFIALVKTSSHAEGVLSEKEGQAEALKTVLNNPKKEE